MTRYLLAFLLCAMSANATTYYIKVGGSNASAGTSWATAWADHTHLNDGTFHGGDTVYFGPGRYKNVNIKPVAGGTNGDKTAYLSGDGVGTSLSIGTARLYGGDSIGGWTVYGSGVYQASFTNPSYGAWGRTMFTLVQGDSILVQNSTGTMPTVPGNFYYDGTANIIYAYPYTIGGVSNPNSFAMWTGNYTVVDFSTASASNVSIVGFDIKYGKQWLIFLGSGQADSSLISNCSLRYVSGPASDNTAVIASYSSGITDTAGFGYRNTIRACYIDYCKQKDGGAANQAYATDFYCQMYLTVESCVVWGGHIYGENALYYKGNGLNGTPPTGLTFRYNQVKGGFVYGLIRIYGKQNRMYIYGNILYNTYSGTQDNRGLMFEGKDAVSATLPCYIYNNTAYSTTKSLSYAYQIGEPPQTPNGSTIYVYRNIASGWYVGIEDRQSNVIVSDSNCLYDCTYMVRNFTKGIYDISYNPGFDNLTTFSRTGAATECNATLPDGKPVTLYGAWQSSVAATTGACCAPDGTCSIQTEADCIAASGTYQGDGTSCSPNPCPVTYTKDYRGKIDLKGKIEIK